MSKTTKVVVEADLRGIALPAKTATYTVISHGFIIDEVRTELAKAGYTIAEEEYRASNNLEIATGSYIIKHKEDPTFAMAFSWVNSYDKSTKFQCAIGGYVWENNGYVIDKEDNASIRKHTGDANAIVQEAIKEKISNADKFYMSVHADKEEMKTITLTRSEVAKILGELFFSYDMLSIEQLSGIKKEYIKPSYMYSTDADSLWTIYCHMLTVIKASHPKTWMQQQGFIHNYLKMNYLFKAPVKSHVPVALSESLVEKDPAQLDLLEQIAEVESKEQFFDISEEMSEEPKKDDSVFWKTFTTARPIILDLESDPLLDPSPITEVKSYYGVGGMVPTPKSEALASVEESLLGFAKEPSPEKVLEECEDFAIKDYTIVGKEIFTADEEPLKIATILDPIENTDSLDVTSETVSFEAEEEFAEKEVLTEVTAELVTEGTIIKLIQEEVNNIFGDETEINVYLNGDNYDAVTTDNQVISVPVQYINNLI